MLHEKSYKRGTRNRGRYQVAQSWLNRLQHHEIQGALSERVDQYHLAVTIVIYHICEIWSFDLFVGVFLKENKKPVINQPAKFLIKGC